MVSVSKHWNNSGLSLDFHRHWIKRGLSLWSILGLGLMLDLDSHWINVGLPLDWTSKFNPTNHRTRAPISLLCTYYFSNIKQRWKCINGKMLTTGISCLSSQFQSKRLDHLHPDHGLVFRSFIYLFDQLKERQDASYVIRASYLEIYNEKVRVNRC